MFFCVKILSMDEKIRGAEKYNFWDGNIPALGYLRKHYTDKIADYVGNGF